MIMFHVACYYSSEFYKTVRERVNKYFKENNIVSGNFLLFCLLHCLFIGSQNMLLDVLSIFCLLYDGHVVLAGHGEWGRGRGHRLGCVPLYTDGVS